MRRATAAVLIAVVLLGAGVVLFRREPRVEEAPRALREHPAIPVPPSPEPKAILPQDVPSPPPTAAPHVVAPDPPKPGLIRGKVQVKGAAPRRKPIRLDADPRCEALHAEPLYSDTLVLDAESNVRWAFVSVKEGLKGRTFAAPAVPVTLAQIGCRYEPHVLGVQVGQPLVIVNRDPLLHNIHALPFRNQGFNFGQPMQDLEERRTFRVEEMVSVRCDVHPWMSAWVGVVEHPYYAVTDPEGRYALPELLPGHYVIEAWQESCEPVSREIDVTAGNALDLDFVLDLRK
jgi:hypothetical protein